MTISMSSYASTIGRLVAENAIASEEANRRILHAGHAANQAQIEIQNAKQEQANGLRSAMAYVEMAQSGVKAGQAVYGAGQAVAEMPEAAKADRDLGRGLKDVKGGGGSDRASLEGVRLGENGPSVGERFTPKQLDVLTSGDKFAYSKADLEAVGFSGPEAAELAARGRGGLTNDEAAHFMWDHRATQEQKNDSHIKQKLQDALIEEPLKSLGRGVGQAAKRLGEEGKRAGETGAQLTEIGNRARDATSKHFEAIDRIELDAIKRGGSTQGTKA